MFKSKENIIKLMAGVLISITLLSACCNSKKDDYQKLIALNTERIKDNPNDYFLYYSRGCGYYMMKNYDKAIKDFQESLRIKENSMSHDGLAMIYLIKNIFDQSLYHADQAVKLSPQTISYYGLRGVCYDLLTKNQKAIEDYSKFLSREYIGRNGEEYYIAYLRRSILYLHNKEYYKSLSDLEQAVKFDDVHEDDVYFLKFMIYARKGDRPNALEFLKTALRNGFNDKNAIYSFVDSVKSIDKKNVEKIINDYMDKDAPLNGFDFDRSEFIVNKFLNIE